MATLIAFWNLLKLNQYMHLCSTVFSPHAFNDGYGISYQAISSLWPLVSTHLSKVISGIQQ